MPQPDDRRQLCSFLDNDADRALLGLVYGRRRIGKSTLLVAEAERREGFYFEATRVETPAQLHRLGEAIGAFLGVGRIALTNWEDAAHQLLRLGDARIPIILDEFGHVLQAAPSVDSVFAAALGPGSPLRDDSRARIVLCGSAIAMMRALTAGEAPLRGRASLELVMRPDDYRTAASRLDDPADLDLAVRVFSTVGGVVGYATDMVGFDLPDGVGDFDRWVVERVLSAASPLHHEATTLLAEDPTLAGTSDLLHHAILGSIANGAVTAGTIANDVGRRVSNLAPALNRLVDAGFVVRHTDPVRKQRPLYSLGDPYLQFHYAILEPHRTALRSRDRHQVWRDRLTATFGSQVRGPVFEQMARTWVERFASEATVGDTIEHVGPSVASIDGTEHQLDVVVAGGHRVPAERQIVAIGEARAGATITSGHLRHLERARAALGPRAASARLLLFGARFDLDRRDGEREDVVQVDLPRLYTGD